MFWRKHVVILLTKRFVSRACNKLPPLFRVAFSPPPNIAVRLAARSGQAHELLDIHSFCVLHTMPCVCKLPRRAITKSRAAPIIVTVSFSFKTSVWRWPGVIHWPLARGIFAHRAWTLIIDMSCFICVPSEKGSRCIVLYVDMPVPVVRPHCCTSCAVYPDAPVRPHLYPFPQWNVVI